MLLVPRLQQSGHSHGRHDHAGTKLPLTTWCLSFYLIGQAKTGISLLELSCHLGVNYETAWLLHNKILHSMTERDDAYLGGELPGDMAARGSEEKFRSSQPSLCTRPVIRFTPESQP